VIINNLLTQNYIAFYDRLMTDVNLFTDIYHKEKERPIRRFQFFK